jgi:DNA repair protein RecO (recombination protein O)
MSGLVRVRGLVLREVAVGEADRILTILSSDMGRFSASAKGARRQNSRLVSATEVLSLCDFSLFGKNGRYVVDCADRIEAFTPVKEDLVRLTCAAHIAELVLDGVREGDSAPGIYRLVLRSLHVLTLMDRDPMLAVRVFEFRLMGQLGYTPVLSRCMVCGEAPSEGRTVRFSFSRCGLVCEKEGCLRLAGESVDLHPGTLSCLRHIASAPEESLFSFSLDPEVQKEFSAFSERYVRERMERDYTRLSLIADWDAAGA